VDENGFERADLRSYMNCHGKQDNAMGVTHGRYELGAAS